MDADRAESSKGKGPCLGFVEVFDFILDDPCIFSEKLASLVCFRESHILLERNFSKLEMALINGDAEGVKENSEFKALHNKSPTQKLSELWTQLFDDSCANGWDNVSPSMDPPTNMTMNVEDGTKENDENGANENDMNEATGNIIED
ncbi:hypothetical protein Sjap_017393 [Stephania japonica]|uniref:Uncharacterized protein n=1 Tax=Stephania japonica TaxID=461633 RepID=A0AAP0I639_9MAGN